MPVDLQGEITHFSQKFINACTSFPNSGKAARDVIDTFSQALDFMEQRRILVNKFEASMFERQMAGLIPNVEVTPRKLSLEKHTYW